MNKFFINIFLFLVLSVVLMAPQWALAADMFFTVSKQQFVAGQEFLVTVSLNTQGESINAAELKIFYPENLLQVKEIQDGNSIVNYWVQRPKVSQTGIINFSGIIPGGYQGSAGPLVSVVFEAKTTGQGQIEIREPQALKNDGQGTSVPVTTPTFNFSILESTGEVPVLDVTKDIEAPENFVPEVSSNPDLFDGQWFVVFAAQDKGSGIDHYEIMETAPAGSPQSLVAKGEWKIALSPYILSDQTLKSDITIKAVDKAGNEKVVTIPAKKSAAIYENYFLWIIILVLGLLLVGYKLWKKSRNQNQN